MEGRCDADKLSLPLPQRSFLNDYKIGLPPLTHFTAQTKTSIRPKTNNVNPPFYKKMDECSGGKHGFGTLAKRSFLPKSEVSHQDRAGGAKVVVSTALRHKHRNGR